MAKFLTTDGHRLTQKVLLLGTVMKIFTSLGKNPNRNNLSLPQIKLIVLNGPSRPNCTLADDLSSSQLLLLRLR